MKSDLEKNEMVSGENPVVPNSIPHEEHGVLLSRERAGQSGIINRLFSNYRSAKAQAKAEIKSLHSREWDGYESRSLLMQKNAEHAPKSVSLTDQVRSLLGRR